MHSGPTPSFYKTQGLDGAIIASLSQISLQINYIYFGIFEDNDIHFLGLLCFY